MEIKVNKEIRDYQEAIFFGLSTRQFVCSLLAVGWLWAVLRPVAPAGHQRGGWVCILGAAPFAACGFFHYHGMTAEQLAWAWLKSEILYPKRLVFQAENLYWEVLTQGEKNR